MLYYSIEVSVGAICGVLDAAEAPYHSLKAIDARGLMIADAASFFAADELRLVGAPCTGVGAVFARRHRAWCS